MTPDRYRLAIRRDINELLQAIDTLRARQDSEVWPVGGQQGKVGVMPTDRGAAKYLAEHWDTL